MRKHYNSHFARSARAGRSDPVRNSTGTRAMPSEHAAMGASVKATDCGVTEHGDGRLRLTVAGLPEPQLFSGASTGAETTRCMKKLPITPP